MSRPSPLPRLATGGSDSENASLSIDSRRTVPARISDDPDNSPCDTVGREREKGQVILALTYAYTMAADNHIRVSDRVKSLIDDRRREGESYSDALERMLGGERDLTDGMGFWADDEADEARETHERGKRKTIERTEK